MDINFQFQDLVAQHLLQLFQTELHAQDRRSTTAHATDTANPPVSLSEDLQNDLIRAAIVLAQAWTYRGE